MNRVDYREYSEEDLKRAEETVKELYTVQDVGTSPLVGVLDFLRIHTAMKEMFQNSLNIPEEFVVDVPKIDDGF